ncbi:hypothetical protein ACSHXN_44945 (plasmid) [Streptomyces sp. HUAS TT11]|uniref:hypothetical protein n=1 Tax=Streptomyces sp. HUAS TT11 TaxID=3447508 RepID=UPI003F656089
MAPKRIVSTCWPMAAAAAVFAFAGCGSGSAASSESGDRSPSSKVGASSKGELAIPEGADEVTKKLYVSQNAVAACMRAKGFTYTPHVAAFADASNSSNGKDYQLAKKYREKYGFGLFAGAVYPNDPSLPGSKAFRAQQDASPDKAYLDALSPAQRKAYDKAMGTVKQLANGRKVELPGCQKEGTEKANGPAKSQAELDRESAANKEQDRLATQALNGDPQLISLAQRFASCLRDQGIAVTTTQPTAIGDMVQFATAQQVPATGVQNMEKDDATAKLTQEIDVALKDLECGKQFRAAYFPKLAKHPFSGAAG